MITGIVLGCYAAVWLLTARLLFARWREANAGARYCEHHGSAAARRIDARYNDGTKPSRCCLDQPGLEDWAAAPVAAVAALVWPAVIAAALIRFRPPPTAAERAASEKKLQARVAELEREAGIT